MTDFIQAHPDATFWVLSIFIGIVVATITQPVTVVIGVQSVTNPTAATVGIDAADVTVTEII